MVRNDDAIFYLSFRHFGIPALVFAVFNIFFDEARKWFIRVDRGERRTENLLF
jgi:hypothetical protein